MNKFALTTVAALPQAGGCMASLPVEIGKTQQVIKFCVDLGVPDFTVASVYIPSWRSFIPTVWPKLDAVTIDAVD